MNRSDPTLITVGDHPHGRGMVVYVGGEWMGFVGSWEADPYAALLCEIARALGNRRARLSDVMPAATVEQGESDLFGGGR